MNRSIQPSDSAPSSGAGQFPVAGEYPERHEAPRNWVTTFIFTGTFWAALLLVPAYGFFNAYDAAEWTAFGLMLAMCGFAITAGYHRLWSHKTYQARTWLRFWWAIWGACALQNTILAWASGHRRHHRHVDDDQQDPYSIGRGFWFAHIGWMLREYPSGELNLENVADLKRDPVVRFQQRHYVALVLLMNIGLPVMLGWLNGDILGMVLLAGLLRLVISHHVTFLINSLCHMIGRRPYTESNSARDNGLLALLTYGEGYHNFHHFFQSDYRNGVRWWQYDPTKWLINLCAWCGQASDLRRTPDLKIQEALVAMQFKRAQANLNSVEQLGEDSRLMLCRQSLEIEYRQFLETLAEWKRLQLHRYSQRKEALADTREAFQHRLQALTLSHQVKQLENALRLQRKRVALLTSAFRTRNSGV